MLMYPRSLGLIAVLALAACGSASEERARGYAHPSIYDEWVSPEDTRQRATEGEKPIGARTDIQVPSDEPVRSARDRDSSPAPRVPEGMLSDVGEVYSIEIDEEPAPESVCPVEPAARSSEITREVDERARYRRPEGSAARVAGGPPEGFERPPGSAASHGHAWTGGFERAPGTADDLPSRAGE